MSCFNTSHIHISLLAGGPSTKSSLWWGWPYNLMRLYFLWLWGQGNSLQDNLTSATHSCLQKYLPLVNGSRSPSFSVCLQRIGFALGIPLIIANLSSLVLQVRLHIHVNNLQPAHQVLWCTLSSLPNCRLSQSHWTVATAMQGRYLSFIPCLSS